MTLNGITNCLLFKASSVLIAINIGYATSALGVNAVLSSLGEKIRNISRLPKGQYTTQPLAPYLGKHPGRSAETRGGVWKKGGHNNGQARWRGADAQWRFRCC